MGNVWFPTLEEILAIHERAIAEFGGHRGLISMGQVRSALDLAKHPPFDQNPSIEKRASYFLIEIGRAHAFVDGNKRTAWMTCELFLIMNGRRMMASDASAKAFMIEVAAGRIGMDAAEIWLRANGTKV